MLRLTLAALAGLLIASSAMAQGTGRSLDIQPGARQNGLGAAGVALADDATGVTWWNPAGLGFVEHSAVELTYAQLVPGLASDVNYNYLTFVHPIEGWGAYGVGIIFLSYGQSEGSDENGVSTGQFGSNEFSPSIYFGTRVLPDLSVGLALKYIRIQLAPSSQQGVGSTFGLDLASLYRIPSAHLSFGLNVQNLGPSVTFINEDQASPLSRNLKIGGAWEAYNKGPIGMLFVTDFNQSLVTTKFRTYDYGAELRIVEQLSGRIGWYSDPLGDISDLTYGIGVNWHSLALDFGAIPQAKNSGLDYVKKITLGYRF
ncbi:MAG TPA: PorV/PorQ family protein [Candidatus Sulfotelmatobacter sp.]|nr:PorV/PorQ family protein [Candidatus Sulfotelmatobacter sp.]